MLLYIGLFTAFTLALHYWLVELKLRAAWWWGGLKQLPHSKKVLSLTPPPGQFPRQNIVTFFLLHQSSRDQHILNNSYRNMFHDFVSHTRFIWGGFSPNKLICLFIEGVNPSFTESFSSSHSALNIYLKAPTSSKSCYSGSLNCEKNYNVMTKHRKSQ